MRHVPLNHFQSVLSNRNFHSTSIYFAGHSKWANIKYIKQRSDIARMAIFTKLSKEIMTSSRLGGSDPEYNTRLAAALSRARNYNFSRDKIENAIRGKTDGKLFEDVLYEGKGPGGSAVLIEALTDNRNRTSNNLKFLFSKYGGNLSGVGSVAWMFEKKRSNYI